MKKRQRVLLLLVILAIITFLDRISISVAAARMQADLHIDTGHWGWILGAFVLSYGLFEIPTGALGDQLGPRRVLTRIVVWWSAFTALTGLTRGFYSLLLTRFLFGIGEAGAYPNIAAALARWFPTRSRAQAQGWIWGASRLGGALAPLIVVPLQRTLGWRPAFLLLGLAGLVWGITWFLWYHDEPAEQPGISSAELAEMPTAVATHRSAGVWGELLRSRQMRLLFAMYWCYGWGPWFYFSWYPLYLMKTAHVTEKQMGILSALPYLLGVITNLAGGAVFDAVTIRRGIRYAGRLIGGGSLFIAGGLMLAMTQIHQQTLLVAISALAFGVGDFMVPAAWAVAMSMGGARAGTVTGTMNTAGQIGGFVCSVLAGYLVETTGSYNSPVFVVASVLILAAILFSRLDGSTEIFSQPNVVDSLAGL